MTTQAKAKFYAVVTGVLGILSALASLPNSDQSALLATIIAVFPPAWRGEITALLHLAMLVSGYATAHYASHSPEPIVATLESTSDQTPDVAAENARRLAMVQQFSSLLKADPTPVPPTPVKIVPFVSSASGAPIQPTPTLEPPTSA